MRVENEGGGLKTATTDELVDEGILLRSKSGKLSMPKEYKKLVSEITGPNGESILRMNKMVESEMEGLMPRLMEMVESEMDGMR